MKMKKIMGITFAMVGILSSAAAETRASPLVVDEGFFQAFAFFNIGTFSGDGFAASNVNTVGGSLSAFPTQPFDTGIVVAGFGHFSGAPPNVFFAGGTGTIQIGNVSCQLSPFIIPGMPDCGGVLTFINTPITLPPNLTPGMSFTADAPFTATGQLVVGQMGSSNLIVDIQGSGILHALTNDGVMNSARYEFAAVPEPSTVVLMVSALVAVGWSRSRRGGDSHASSQV
jgi:hypothetical protein